MTRGLRRKVRGRSLLRATTFLSNRAISFLPNETERVNLHWTREKLGKKDYSMYLISIMFKSEYRNVCTIYFVHTCLSISSLNKFLTKSPFI